MGNADEHSSWAIVRPLAVILGFFGVLAFWVVQWFLEKGLSFESYLWLGAFGASLIILFLISGEFSQRSLRVAIVLLVAASVMQLISIGRSSHLADTRDSSRTSATNLYSDHKDLAALEEATLAGVTGASKATGDQKERLTDAQPGSQLIAPLTALQEAFDKNLDSDQITPLLDNLIGVTATTDLEKDVVAQANATATSYEAGKVAELRKVQVIQAKTAIDEACAGGDGVPAKSTVGELERTRCDKDKNHISKPLSGRDLAVQLTEAKYLMAQLASEITPSDEAKALAKTRLEEFDAALAKSKEREERASATQSARDGANAIVRALTPDEADLPVGLDLLSWIVVLSLLLSVYRWFEIRSARGALGPVEIVVATGATIPAEFRHALVRNVPEPGAVPGSSALSQLTDLLEAAEPSGFTGKIVKVINTILGTPSGYQVTYSTEEVHEKKSKDTPDPTAAAADPPPAKASTDAKKEDDDPKPVWAMVQVLDRRNKQGLAVQRFPAAEPESAAITAGYWAAAWIIDHSSEVPSWSRFNPDTAVAFSASQRQADHGLPALDMLQIARAHAPSSGVVLVLLGQRFELADDYASALECYLRAAIVHPRYIVARYRAAAALHVIARDSSKYWWSGTDEASRSAILRQLTLLRPDYQPLKKIRADVPSAVSGRFRNLAVSLVEELRGSNWTHVMLWRSLRRSERHYWLSWARLGAGGRLRRSLKWSCESAKQAIEADLVDKDVATDAKSILKKARALNSYWQVSYNMACAYAIQSTRTIENNSDNPAAGPSVNALVASLKASAESVDTKLQSVSASPAPSQNRAVRTAYQKTLEQILSDAEKLCNQAAAASQAGRTQLGPPPNPSMASRDMSIEEALRLLEQSLERRGSEQLTAAFMESDPDLKALYEQPRFKRVAKQLHFEEEAST